MADKKLNAVSTASDGAYIYAEDSSGNQIKISKADLATVVAGVIGNVFFANPVSIGSKTINDKSLTPGAYTFSGAQAEGLTSYSGVLFISGTDTQVRIVVSIGCLAFKRSDETTWNKVTFTTA